MTTMTDLMPEAKVPELTPRERFELAMNNVAHQFERQMKCLKHRETDDDRVLAVWYLAHQVAEDVANLSLADEDDGFRALNRQNLQFDVESLAAFACAWVSPAVLSNRVVEQIWRERERQRALFRQRKIAFDVASPIPDARRKFRVLAEEVGEVAHAIDQIENHGLARGNLHAELIQVAAVCVAWLESLPTATEEVES